MSSVDYSGGTANFDPENEIHYGVIPAHALCDWIWEAGEYIYPEPEDDADDSEAFDMEPYYYRIDRNGFEAEVSVGSFATDSDFFVTASRFFTLCDFCSPCAPGAGYLLSQSAQNCKAYCPGPYWFRETEPLPFDIYSVETGNLICRRGSLPVSLDSADVE